VTLSKSKKKFGEWRKKLRETLDTEKSNLASLPEQCRWFRYWGEKLRHEEPERYAEIEGVEIELLSKVADVLSKNYLSYLKKAQKHRKGTKIRLTEIMRYVYYFGNYAYSNYIASAKEDKARKILQTFWNTYQRELTDSAEKLNDSQVLWLLRLIKQSKDQGIEIESRSITRNFPQGLLYEVGVF
jgi:hypothetical protein